MDAEYLQLQLLWNISYADTNELSKVSVLKSAQNYKCYNRFEMAI